MWKWLTRLLLWPFAFLCAIIVLAFFLIQLEPVQKIAAQQILSILNRKFSGRIEVDFVALQLHGAVQIRGFQLHDSTGTTILSAERAQVWLAPWDLVHGRVHVLKANLDGVRASFVVDTTGNNFTHAFATEPTPDQDTTHTPLWVRLDRLSVDIDSLSIRVDTTFQKTFANLDFNGHLLLTDSVITYKAIVSQESIFTIASQGVIRPYSDSMFVGDAVYDGTSQFIQANWVPEFPELGHLTVTANADVEADNLTSTFNILLADSGRIKGDIKIEDYMHDPYITLDAAFQHLNLSLWIGDSIAHDFSGHATLVKSKSPEWSHDWSGRIGLDSSFYGDIHVTADVETELFADAVSITGDVHTNAGVFDLSVHVDGLNPDSLSLFGYAVVTDVNLHAFVPAIPDSLSPLSGKVELSADMNATSELAADATLQLGELSLGRYKLDSLSFHATIDGTTFILDSTHLQLGSASALLFARGDFTKNIAAEFEADIPAIEEFRDLLVPFVPLFDTLSGDATLKFVTLLTISGDTLSDISANGQMTSENITLGGYSAHKLDAQVDSLVMSTEFLRLSLHCDSVTIGNETVTPAVVMLAGQWNAPSFTCSLAARGDTLRLAASGQLNFKQSPYSIEVEEFDLSLFGTLWHNDFPIVANFDSLHYEIEALVLRSDYGVLRATGYIENPGQQDLVVEFSGFKTGALSQIFNTEIPDGDLNLRVQFSGSDDAIVGNLELLIDSVKYQESHLADRIQFTAQLGEQGAFVADATYIWFGDTALVATATLPATLSLEYGLVIPEGEQLSGTMKVDSLPLTWLAPWMSPGILIEGKLSADLILKGSALRPDWGGKVELTDGFFRDTRYGIAYKWIVLDAELQRDSLIINSFRATSRGTMTGSGSARLGVPWPEELDLKLKFDKFEAVSSRIQKVRMDGEINLSGPFDSLNADGSLIIQEGLFRLTQSATKTIEIIDLDSVVATLRGDTSDIGFNTDALYESMSLNLAIEVPGNFWIRGAGLNTELSGSLQLRKEHYQEPMANGEIAIRSGTVKFYGRELRIEDNSTLTFDGPADSPELSITAVYKGADKDRGYEVEVRLTGTPDKSLAEFSGKFDDGSAMSEDEAIQKLLPFASSADGYGFNAEQSVVDAASGQVSDIVSNASGLDVFEFRPGSGGLSDLSSGQLELGTYVTDRLFVRVFQPIEDPRSGQKVSIDYRLLDWMKITAEQESKAQSSTSSSFTVYLQFEWR